MCLRTPLNLSDAVIREIVVYNNHCPKAAGVSTGDGENSSYIIARDIAFAYPHTKMRLVHIDPDWSMHVRVAYYDFDTELAQLLYLKY
eukprot:COSAG01_NODE_596_length_15055_cov_17.624967_13_plen_88_part_00